MQPVTLADAKAHLGGYVDQVNAGAGEVLITRKGRPAAVLMGHEAYEGWRETVAILRDQELLRGIRAGLTSFAQGRAQVYDSLDAVFTDGR
jgi:prevent-host-death family protein